MKLKKSSLDWRMESVFEGNLVWREAVMFIEPTDEKKLLFPIEKILSLTSYDEKTVYEEGRDYIVKDGCLTLPATTSIPCITQKNYFGGEDEFLKTEQDGGYVNTYYGNTAKWQLLVTYEHKGGVEHFRQPCCRETFLPLLEKMEAGEDVTFLFYGDSITTGGDASAFHHIPPYEPGFCVLFTEAMAKLFGYAVKYIKPDLEGTVVQSDRDPVYGTRGTITCVNSAVGGWSSKKGLEEVPTYVLPMIKQYGCDLFVNAFGMNSGASDPANAALHAKATVEAARALVPNACFLLISTMLPNPLATNRWYINQYRQEPFFLDVARSLREEGTACAVAQMTSVSRSSLTRKDFRDQSGNNINHPNDFFYRVYAQTLLQTVVGYENLSSDN